MSSAVLSSGNDAVAHHQMFDDWSESEGRQEREQSHDDDDSQEQATEDHAVGREGARAGSDTLFRGHAPGDHHHWDDEEEAADERAYADAQVVEGAVGAEAGERRPVVRGTGS